MHALGPFAGAMTGAAGTMMPRPGGGFPGMTPPIVSTQQGGFGGVLQQLIYQMMRHRMGQNTGIVPPPMPDMNRSMVGQVGGQVTGGQVPGLG